MSASRASLYEILELHKEIEENDKKDTTIVPTLMLMIVLTTEMMKITFEG